MDYVQGNNFLFIIEYFLSMLVHLVGITWPNV